MRGDPDFPEVEFGVAPFGNTSSNLTSPTYSSTTLLPMAVQFLAHFEPAAGDGGGPVAQEVGHARIR